MSGERVFRLKRAGARAFATGIGAPDDEARLHDDAQQHARRQTEAGRMPDRASGQIEDAGRFIFVHRALPNMRRAGGNNNILATKCWRVHTRV